MYAKNKDLDINNNAFTLVELIVVIVILAILATIAFLSFSDYSSSARDSARLSDTANIRKGIELRQAIGGSIPLPANPKVHTGGATATGVTGVTITEGTVSNSILSTLSAGIKDPSGGEYRYSTISQGGQPLYYQLALELENSTSLKKNSVNPFLAFGQNIASAEDASKTVQLKGSYTFDPSLPSLFVLSGSTSSASGGIYNPDLCFALDGSSANTFSNPEGCIAKRDMSLKDYDSSIVGYWDMETLTADGKLRDLSGNGNEGVFSGGMNYADALTGGVIGKGLSFNGGSDHINCGTGNSLEIGQQLTLVAIVRPRQDALKGIFTKQSAGTKLDAGTNCGVNNYCGYMLRTQTGSLVGRTYDNAIRSYGTQDRSVSIADKGYLNNFRYIAFTAKDGEGGKIYVNGAGFNTGNKIVGTITISKNPLLIGRYWNDVTPGIGYDYFDGVIDSIIVYNRVLSDSEIIQQSKTAGF